MMKALHWAVESGAQVISISLGLDFTGLVDERVRNGCSVKEATSFALDAFQDNIRLMDGFMRTLGTAPRARAGTVIVAAAGNESQRPSLVVSATLPASAHGVISVGAVTKSPAGLDVAPFSNKCPTLAAPGVDIPSAKCGGGIVSKSGTSMAAPHVAGVAALCWQALVEKKGSASARTVKAKLADTARYDVFSTPLSRVDHGDGLVCAPNL